MVGGGGAAVYYFCEITAKCPHIYLICVCLLETAIMVRVRVSRANNCDTYSQSQDLNIHYIIQRGATVDILTDLTCSFL